MLPAVQRLPDSEKFELVRLLLSELCDGQTISPFEPFKTYLLPTPYNAFGVGASLMQAMQSAELGWQVTTMRFKYSTTGSSQNEFDSLPWVPLILTHQDHSLEVVGLVDSGATVNVLPYEAGFGLG